MRVAWLYPSTGLLDGSVHDIARVREVQVFTIRVSADPGAPIESLGDLDRLRNAAELARELRPDVIAWACTAGSFIAGSDHEQRQCELLANTADCPSTTTSRAIAWSIRQLRVSRVLALTPYNDQVGAAMCEHLQTKGFKVAAHVHAGYASDEVISAMTIEDILALLPPTLQYAGADCVVMPCTALRSERAAAAVTAATHLPTVTANLATMDHALYTAYASEEGARR